MQSCFSLFSSLQEMIFSRLSQEHDGSDSLILQVFRLDLLQRGVATGVGQRSIDLLLSKLFAPQSKRQMSGAQNGSDISRYSHGAFACAFAVLSLSHCPLSHGEHLRELLSRSFRGCVCRLGRSKAFAQLSRAGF